MDASGVSCRGEDESSILLAPIVLAASGSFKDRAQPLLEVVLKKGANTLG